MGPRRGDVAEERREGESVELGGRITEMEGKIDALDGRVASLEERLTALGTRCEQGFSSLEALIRSSLGTQAQTCNVKGKGPLPTHNSEIQQADPGEEDPPLQVTDSLQVPSGEGEGVGQGNRGGRLHIGNPRQGRPWARGDGWGDGREVGGPRQGLLWANWGPDRGGPQGCYPRERRPWAEFDQGGADHHEPTIGRPTDHMGGGPRGLGGGHSHIRSVEGQVSREGPQGGYWQGTSWLHYNNGMERWDNTTYGRGENLHGGGISAPLMEEKGRGHQERLFTMYHGKKGDRLEGRRWRGSRMTSHTRKEGSKVLTWRTLFCSTREGW